MTRTAEHEQQRETVAIPLDPSWGEIREGVRRICEQYPNEYWVKLDHESAYPTEFVDALTKAGYLGALIPEEYGGAGLPLSAGCAILETIHETGCNAAACHAQMYTMGTVLRHGNAAQKRKYLPGIASGELRLQAFGVTEPTTGSDTTQLKTRADKKGNDRYVVNGQKVWTSRVLHSDLMLLLARTTPPDKVRKRSEGLSVFLVDLREAQGKGRRDPEDRRHDQPQHLRGVLRQPRGAGREPDRRGGPGLPLHRRQHERRAHPDRLGVARRRQVFHPPRRRVCQGAHRVRPADRPEPGRAFPIARAHAETVAAELMVREGRGLFEAERDCGAEANMGKMLAADAAWTAAEACLQTFGGFGYAREYGIERKWRETRLYQTAPISTNMILAYVAQHVLGLPRSY